MERVELRLGGAVHVLAAWGYAVVIAVHFGLLALLTLAVATRSLPFEPGLFELAIFLGLLLLFALELRAAWKLWRCVRRVRREPDGTWTLLGLCGARLGALAAGTPRSLRLHSFRLRPYGGTGSARLLAVLQIEADGRLWTAPTHEVDRARALVQALEALR
ncbi:MAG: hypothetical protein JNM84_28130 [Planctomycetes bacterium]|nr:hypothetical protein [Planctomycetota bacterium]